MSELEIEVLGLVVHAHHGVREHEKARGQRFVLDLVLEPRSSAGCESDRLDDTVSYSDADLTPGHLVGTCTAVGPIF